MLHPQAIVAVVGIRKAQDLWSTIDGVDGWWGSRLCTVNVEYFDGEKGFYIKTVNNSLKRAPARTR